jgi:hypothetical protein
VSLALLYLLDCSCQRLFGGDVGNDGVDSSVNGTAGYVLQLLFSATENIDSTSAIRLDFVLATLVARSQCEI